MISALVDIDDTISNTQEHLLSIINQRSSRAYQFDELSRRFREGGEAEYEALVRAVLEDPELMAQCQPYEDALEGIKKLHQANIEIHIASSRREILHLITLEWLKRHGFIDFVTQVHGRVSNDKGVEFKVKAAQAAEATVAFDDTYNIVEVLAQVVPTVYMIDKPWNRDQSLPDNVITSKSFSWAVDHYLELTK